MLYHVGRLCEAARKMAKPQGRLCEAARPVADPASIVKIGLRHYTRLVVIKFQYIGKRLNQTGRNILIEQEFHAGLGL